VTAVFLFGVTGALIFSGELTPDQKMRVAAASARGAVGLLIGYSIG